MVMILALTQGGFFFAYRDQGERLDRALAAAAANREKEDQAISALADARALIEARGSCVCPTCPKQAPCPSLRCPSCPTLTCPPQQACPKCRECPSCEPQFIRRRE